MMRLSEAIAEGGDFVIEDMGSKDSAGLPLVIIPAHVWIDDDDLVFVEMGSPLEGRFLAHRLAGEISGNGPWLVHDPATGVGYGVRYAFEDERDILNRWRATDDGKFMTAAWARGYAASVVGAA